MPRPALPLLLVLALLAVATAGLVLPRASVLAEEDDDASPSAAQLSQALAQAKITLDTAVKTAATNAKGVACEAEFEMDDGKPVFEVLVVATVDGTPQLFEVEIDAVTGKVLETERVGAHDDEGDDDHDDEGEGE